MEIFTFRSAARAVNAVADIETPVGVFRERAADPVAMAGRHHIGGVANRDIPTSIIVGAASLAGRRKRDGTGRKYRNSNSSKLDLHEHELSCHT
jgi:hypothetical protein